MTTTNQDQGVQIITRVPVEMHTEIKVLAARRDLTMAQLVRRALKSYLHGATLAELAGEEPGS